PQCFCQRFESFLPSDSRTCAALLFIRTVQIFDTLELCRLHNLAFELLRYLSLLTAQADYILFAVRQIHGVSTFNLTCFNRTLIKSARYFLPIASNKRYGMSRIDKRDNFFYNRLMNICFFCYPTKCWIVDFHCHKSSSFTTYTHFTGALVVFPLATDHQ